MYEKPTIKRHAGPPLDQPAYTRLDNTSLTKGQEYTDQGQDYYEERYRERVLRQLAKRAEKLGMKLVAAPQPI